MSVESFFGGHGYGYDYGDDLSRLRKKAAAGTESQQYLETNRAPDLLTPQEVVLKLKDILGLKIFEKVLNFLKENPSITHIIVIGLPGSGKSIFIKGMKVLLELEGIESELRKFDEYTVEFFTPLGKTEQSQLTDQEKIAFHDDYSTKMRKPPTPHPSGKRTVVLAEAPSEGLQNLGQKALLDFAAAEDPRQPTFLVIDIMADPDVELHAIQVRNLARELFTQNPLLTDFELKTALLSITPLYGKAELQDHDSTQIVQELCYSATADQMLRIREERLKKRHESEQKRLRALLGLAEDTDLSELNMTLEDPRLRMILEAEESILNITLSALESNVPEWISLTQAQDPAIPDTEANRTRGKIIREKLKEILYNGSRFMLPETFIFPEDKLREKQRRKTRTAFTESQMKRVIVGFNIDLQKKK